MYEEGGVTDFSGNVFRAKINVRGDLGQANFKNFRRFAPKNLKFVLQKDSEKRRLKEENEEYMMDNEEECMEEGRSSRRKWRKQGRQKQVVESNEEDIHNPGC